MVVVKQQQPQQQPQQQQQLQQPQQQQQQQPQQQQQRRCVMVAKPRPTVFDFVPGTPYTVGAVASLFGRSHQWVRDRIAAGDIRALKPNSFAGRPAKASGKGEHYLIDGEEVRRYYGAELLIAERREVGPAKLPGDLSKHAAKRLKELKTTNTKEKR